MRFIGHVENGVVVFDQAPKPEDGEWVAVELAIPEATNNSEDKVLPIGRRLLKFSGKSKRLHEDAAEQHDHYLYGTPKR